MQNFFLFPRFEGDVFLDVESGFGVDKTNDVVAGWHFDFFRGRSVVFAVDIDVGRRLAGEQENARYF